MGMMRRILPGQRGFTLVELMIAMALVGVLTAVIYGLFTRTSDSLSEVEEMSTTLDRARFALAMVRQDLQSAGSQATPNAAVDPYVRPPVINENIHAVMIYDGWEDNRGVYDESGVPDGMGAENPRSRFSGFVVIGALDFPQSFFVEEMNPTPPGAEFVVKATERGVGRLNVIDPFDVFAGNVNILGDSDRLEDDMTGRLLRVMDGQGFFQFSPISQANVSGNELELTASSVRFRGTGEIAGLEMYMEPDEALDVALLDAFWYRVRVDPLDPTNFQLVRERLNAADLIGMTALSEEGLEGITIDDDLLVVADHVVDFRVWFDCIPSSGQWAPVPRQDGWDITNGASSCLDDDLQQSNPQRLRIAHVRLSLRTPTENANRPHLQIVDGWEGFQDADGAMVTYNVFPWARGSAGVVTLQSTIEMTNFAMRGVL